NINNKIILVSNISNSIPQVIVCNPSLSGCIGNDYPNILAMAEITSSVIDPIHNKIYFFGRDVYDESKMRMFRCEINGTACTNRNISDLTGTTGNGYYPDAVVDTVSKKIYAVSENRSTNNSISYWSIPLYIEDP
ncbi:MAG TPA: hypothetical protein PK683_20480, partial [Leptospiraceae bacterium]|nr:hypothetical protein [Leptospiraceae bacterium]